MWVYMLQKIGLDNAVKKFINKQNQFLNDLPEVAQIGSDIYGKRYKQSTVPKLLYVKVINIVESQMECNFELRYDVTFEIVNMSIF